MRKRHSFAYFIVKYLYKGILELFREECSKSKNFLKNMQKILDEVKNADKN